MLREVNLINYLPHFLQTYREIGHITTAENPEFQFLCDESERIKDNQFIQTCDIDGISRFEKLLGITPLSSDTLESRRSKVMLVWSFNVPYTMKCLFRKIHEICGDEYSVILDGYYLKIITHLYSFEDIENRCQLIREMLREIVPCNMLVDCVSMIRYFELKQFTHRQMKKFTNAELKNGTSIEIRR